jgi:hypothetical protein
MRHNTAEKRLNPVSLVLAVLAVVVQSAIVGAQFSSSRADDIAGLDRRLAEARTTLATARTAPGVDAAELSRLEVELEEIGDEIAYLRVKTRRGEKVSDTDRRDVASRLSRAETRLTALAPDSGEGADIPVGTEIDVRLQTPLSSKDAKVEQRVDATTVVDLSRHGRVLVPAGSAVRGHVVEVDPASRLDRRGRLVITFTRLTVEKQTHDVTLSITQALESEGIRGEAGRIGVGAGVGAIIGGILNGVKGVLTGILIGGGGTVLATEGKDVELPVGTILRVRFDAPLDLEQ